MSKPARYLIETRTGTQGPVSRERLQRWVEKGKLPLRLKIRRAGDGRVMRVAEALGIDSQPAKKKRTRPDTRRASGRLRRSGRTARVKPESSELAPVAAAEAAPAGTPKKSLRAGSVQATKSSVKAKKASGRVAAPASDKAKKTSDKAKKILGKAKKTSGRATAPASAKLKQRAGKPGKPSSDAARERRPSKKSAPARSSRRLKAGARKRTVRAVPSAQVSVRTPLLASLCLPILTLGGVMHGLSGGGTPATGKGRALAAVVDALGPVGFGVLGGVACVAAWFWLALRLRQRRQAAAEES